MMDTGRFQQAIDQVVTLEERERHGIGMQMEKTLHAVVKNYLDDNLDHQEIPIVGNFIADIYNGKEIFEIQNGNFYKMRAKLDAFLPLYPVTIVYPIPHVKYITWIDPETGELGKRNRSPKCGNFYMAFRELYRIRPYLNHENLKLKLLLVDLEEYRLQDGWGNGGKRGSHRFDRVPTALFEEMDLESARDYLAFLPIDLPEDFTSAQVAKAAGFKSEGFSTVLQILTDLQVTERIGKKGKAYLYRITDTYGDTDT